MSKFANELSARQVETIWDSVFNDYRITDNDKKTAFKHAVYEYFMINGASDQTSFNFELEVSTETDTDLYHMESFGKRVRGNFRKFVRACQVEAYHLLMRTERGAEIRDDIYSKKKTLLPGPNMAAAAVDFFDRVHTVEEARLAQKLRRVSIAQSNVNRVYGSRARLDDERRVIANEVAATGAMPNAEYEY